MNLPQKVIVSVSTDLSSDQRVQKLSESLSQNNYAVSLIGRKLKNSKFFEDKLYDVQRFNLWFNKGFLFYANLNLRLFIKLLYSEFDVLYANDLDVLPANYLAAKVRGKHLVYDSHEYFTEVPELVNRPNVQQFWERIEQLILPKLKNCITVTSKIAMSYKKKYGVDFKLVRNFPLLRDFEKVEKVDYIIYQGALNVGRGLEELLDAMPTVNSKLWIAGGGDIEMHLKEIVEELGLKEKVEFLGRLLPKELKAYTAKAKLGVSIEQKLGLNYTYALPNKIFDYIHAGTPVLYSDLVEVKETLKTHLIGEELESYEPKTLSSQLNRMLQSSNYKTWEENCKTAAQEFNWQQEEKVLLSIFDNLSN